MKRKDMIDHEKRLKLLACINFSALPRDNQIELIQMHEQLSLKLDLLELKELDKENGIEQFVFVPKDSNLTSN